MAKITLKHWFIARTEQNEFYVVGCIYGSPKFHDGEYINTSNVRMIHLYPDRLVVKTQNSSYDALFSAFASTEMFKENFVDALVENGLSRATADLIFQKAARVAKEQMAG